MWVWHNPFRSEFRPETTCYVLGYYDSFRSDSQKVYKVLVWNSDTAKFLESYIGYDGDRASIKAGEVPTPSKFMIIPSPDFFTIINPTIEETIEK